MFTPRLWGFNQLDLVKRIDCWHVKSWMVLSCREITTAWFFFWIGDLLGLATLYSFRGYKREDLVKRDVYVLLFQHRKTQQACRIFIDWLKKGCEASPSEVSQFARDLQLGKVVKGFRYRRESFYETILKKLVAFEFICKELRFSHRVVYVGQVQPIPRRAPKS